jgi:MFS family permease
MEREKEGQDSIGEKTLEGKKLDHEPKSKHSWRFWLVFAALCLISFISAIDSTIITVALPTMTRAIGGEKDYVSMANVFVFAATTIQPLFGQVSNIFGRRWPMIVSIALFALGSGITAGANSVAMFVAGRTVQGLGSGGLFVLLNLIVCDLVPLRERGKYLGFMLSTAAVGTVIGPIVGGALTSNWRWIFYLNLPISGLALVAMFAFLKVKPRRDVEALPHARRLPGQLRFYCLHVRSPVRSDHRRRSAPLGIVESYCTTGARDSWVDRLPLSSGLALQGAQRTTPPFQASHLRRWFCPWIYLVHAARVGCLLPPAVFSGSARGIAAASRS